jgi:hypothetical protein
MLTMADRLMDRARRVAAMLAPFIGVFVIVIHGKRW